MPLNVFSASDAARALVARQGHIGFRMKIQCVWLNRPLGTVIGKCENILVITFVLGGEFTALAVVFAGKSILRAEDIRGNPEYYLGGTLVNFTYSLVWSLLLRHILAQL